MLKKSYKWIAIILSVYVFIDTGSLEEMGVMLFYFCVLYFGFKWFFSYLRRDVRSSGGLLRWFMDSADTTSCDKKVFDNVWNSFQSGNSSGGRDSRREADQRVFNRTKARNEAAFHQYYANKNKGTYDGYRSQNRANNARDRARRY